MKKIAIVTNGILPLPAVKGGGAETLVQQLLDENEKQQKYKFIVYSVLDKQAVQAQKKYKYSQFMFVPHKQDNLLSKIKRFYNRKIYGIKTYPEPIDFKKIIKLIDKSNVDEIILENTIQPFISYTKKNDKKVWLHLHNDFINTELDNRYVNLIKNAVNKSAGIITVSNYIKHRVLELENVSSSKIRVLKNCTNLEIFRPLSFEEKNKYRAKYGIGQDEFAILFAGRISREKGVMQLLNVVENLNKKYSNIKTIIVGSSKSGTNNIDSYTSDVIAKIKKLGDKVKFTSYIKYKELGNVYNVADVAVFPAIWEEPAELTIIEAMACKIPVITTYSGGIVEYTDKNSSILCNKDERLEKELEENIIKIIENKKLSNKIAENGYKKAKEYNLQKYYEEFCKIIDRNSES